MESGGQEALFPLQEVDGEMNKCFLEEPPKFLSANVTELTPRVTRGSPFVQQEHSSVSKKDKGK